MAAQDTADATPIVLLLRTEGAPPGLIEKVCFSASNTTASVGRFEGNTIVINDKKVSKAHCRFTLRACKKKGAEDGEILKRLFVKDSSSFGTFVNGKALVKEQWILLNEGDVVGFRNPHGNPSLGEYYVQYHDGTTDPAALAAKAAPVTITPSSEPIKEAPVADLPPPTVVQPSAPPSDPRAARLQASKPPQQEPPRQPVVVTLPEPQPVQKLPQPIVTPKQAPPEEDGLPPQQVPRPPPLDIPSKKEDGNEEAGPPGDDCNAEPLSPLSEVTQVSEVSADDGPEQGPMAGIRILPGGFPMGVPGLLPPGTLATLPIPGMSVVGGSGTAPAEESTSAPAAEPQPPPKPVIITVAAELVGMLIGKGGEVVKQLSKDSGARIEISKGGTETNGERTVYLSGQPDCVDHAKKLIDETLSKARERSGMNNPNAHVLKVPHELVGMLIGKGGETIKELKKESGARIDISKEPTEGTSVNDRLVHISGPPECVEYARKMIEDMLGRSRERGGEGSIVSFKDTTPTSALVKVPHELIGMLIGKSGETIKAISRDSGSRIEIAKDEAAEREEARSVHISGPPECLEKAKRLIEETLNRSRERQGDEKRSDRAGNDRDRHRDFSVAPGGQVLHVAQDLIGMLIGRAGETIKGISTDTGARIEISKDDRDSSSRTVTLSGPPEAIEKAREAIEEVLGKARERLEGRSERKARDREEDRQMALAAHGDDGRSKSPIKDTWISEKVYVDECDMPFRPNFRLEHEDGLPTDLEIFIRGLPEVCTERDLWEHLYRLGATDVKEILLLRRQKTSKGMAYVVFNRHDHAILAKHKFHGAPAWSIACGGQMQSEEKGTITVRFSESERCINGRSNVYATDMVGLLLGSKGKCMSQVKEGSGLRKALLTGRNMKSYGQVDEDPRLHMVVYYEPDEVSNVAKAIEVWADQLGRIHKEIAEKAMLDGRGKGFGKGWPEYWPPPPMMPPPPHAYMEVPPMRPPMMPPPPDGAPPGPLPARPPLLPHEVDPSSMPPPPASMPPPLQQWRPPGSLPLGDMPMAPFDVRPPFDGRPPGPPPGPPGEGADPNGAPAPEADGGRDRKRRRHRHRRGDKGDDEPQQQAPDAPPGEHGQPPPGEHGQPPERPPDHAPEQQPGSPRGSAEPHRKRRRHHRSKGEEKSRSPDRGEAPKEKDGGEKKRHRRRRRGGSREKEEPPAREASPAPSNS